MAALASPDVLPPVIDPIPTPLEIKTDEVTIIARNKYATLGKKYNSLPEKELKEMKQNSDQAEVWFYHRLKTLPEEIFQQPVDLSKGQPVFFKDRGNGVMIVAVKGEPGAVQAAGITGRTGNNFECVLTGGVTAQVDTQVMLDSQIIASYELSKDALGPDGKPIFTSQEKQVIEAFIASQKGNTTLVDALNPQELKEAAASCAILSESVVALIDQVAPAKTIPPADGPDKVAAEAYNKRREGIKQRLDGKIIATSEDVTAIMNELAQLSLPDQINELDALKAQRDKIAQHMEGLARDGSTESAYTQYTTELAEVSQKINVAQRQVQALEQAQILLSQPDNPVTSFFHDIDTGDVSPEGILQINDHMRKGDNDKMVEQILAYQKEKLGGSPEGQEKYANMQKLLRELAPAAGGGVLLLLVLLAMQASKGGHQQ